MMAYIMQFNLTILFIKGSRNLLADGLSDISAQERAEHEATFMHDDDDFVLPVSTRSAQRAALRREIETVDAHDAPEALIRSDGPETPVDAADGPTTEMEVGNVDSSDPLVYTDESTIGHDVTNNALEPLTNADDEDKSPVVFPVISPQDFETYEKFRDMYKYLDRE